MVVDMMAAAASGLVSGVVGAVLGYRRGRQVVLSDDAKFVAGDDSSMSFTIGSAHTVAVALDEVGPTAPPTIIFGLRTSSGRLSRTLVAANEGDRSAELVAARLVVRDTGQELWRTSGTGTLQPGGEVELHQTRSQAALTVNATLVVDGDLKEIVAHPMLML